MESIRTIARIRDLLSELENHEYVHINGLNRIMDSVRLNVKKLGVELEEEYWKDELERSM